MARPNGALVWLQLHGQWLLSRLTGNWTSAEAAVLQVKGQGVQPDTLKLLYSCGTKMSEATTVKLQMSQAIWLPATADNTVTGVEGARGAVAPPADMLDFPHFVATHLRELGRLKAEAPKREWRASRKLHASLTVTGALQMAKGLHADGLQSDWQPHMGSAEFRAARYLAAWGGETAAALGFESTDDDPSVCPCVLGGICSLHPASEMAQPTQSVPAGG